MKNKKNIPAAFLKNIKKKSGESTETKKEKPAFLKKKSNDKSASAKKTILKKIPKKK